MSFDICLICNGELDDENDVVVVSTQKGKRIISSKNIFRFIFFNSYILKLTFPEFY